VADVFSTASPMALRTNCVCAVGLSGVVVPRRAIEPTGARIYSSHNGDNRNRIAEPQPDPGIIAQNRRRDRALEQRNPNEAPESNTKCNDPSAGMIAERICNSRKNFHGEEEKKEAKQRTDSVFIQLFHGLLQTTLTR
jgi:hypothetical protein